MPEREEGAYPTTRCPGIYPGNSAILFYPLNQGHLARRRSSHNISEVGKRRVMPPPTKEGAIKTSKKDRGKNEGEETMRPIRSSHLGPRIPISLTLFALGEGAIEPRRWKVGGGKRGTFDEN